MLYDLFNRTNLYLSLDLKMGKNLKTCHFRNVQSKKFSVGYCQIIDGEQNASWEDHQKIQRNWGGEEQARTRPSSKSLNLRDCQIHLGEKEKKSEKAVQKSCERGKCVHRNLVKHSLFSLQIPKETTVICKLFGEMTNQMPSLLRVCSGRHAPKLCVQG